jgi:hypothetical protein
MMETNFLAGLRALNSRLGGASDPSA